MTEPRVRQYLPAIAEVFAQYAAVAMILWFDRDEAFDDEIDGDELETRRARAGAKWVRDLQVRCRRLMLEALESDELQRIVSAMETGSVEPDAVEPDR
jgi:hypothetical protein